MRLDDDDEVYLIDQSYLGPPGRYIGVMRYKVILLWLLIGPVVFVMLRRAGVPMTLLSVGLSVLLIHELVGWLADRITSERSFLATASVFWHEVTAPRGEGSRASAAGGDLRVVGRPRGRRADWTSARATRRAAEERRAGDERARARDASTD